MATSHLDNYHCFKGMGHAYWRSLASGFQPLGTVPGSQGHQMVYAKDPDDGFALQNGGIAHPTMQILPARALIRFMAAGRTGKSGLAGRAGGGRGGDGRGGACPAGGGDAVGRTAGHDCAD